MSACACMWAVQHIMLLLVAALCCMGVTCCGSNMHYPSAGSMLCRMVATCADCFLLQHMPTAGATHCLQAAPRLQCCPPGAHAEGQPPGSHQALWPRAAGGVPRGVCCHRVQLPAGNGTGGHRWQGWCRGDSMMQQLQSKNESFSRTGARNTLLPHKLCRGSAQQRRTKPDSKCWHVLGF